MKVTLGLMTPGDTTMLTMESSRLKKILANIEPEHGCTGSSSSSSSARAHMTLEDWKEFMHALILYAQLIEQTTDDEQGKQPHHDMKPEASGVAQTGEQASKTGIDYSESTTPPAEGNPKSSGASQPVDPVSSENDSEDGMEQNVHKEDTESEWVQNWGNSPDELSDHQTELTSMDLNALD